VSDEAHRDRPVDVESDERVGEAASGESGSGTNASGVRRQARDGDMPPWRRLARLLAPVVLATAAVGAHVHLNVPDAETLAIAESQRKPAAPTKPKPKAKPQPRKPEANAFEARTEAQLARLARRYEAVDFEEEPIVSAWARRHQNLVNKAVVVARRHAFEGAPEEPGVIVTGTRCRTVRCRFLLRSPYPHELDLLDQTLARLQADGRPLWRLHTSERIDPPRGGPPEDAYLEVTVAFTTDEPEARTFEVAESGSP
jgi:hypothetical protein